MNPRTRGELFGLFLTVPRLTAPQLVSLAAPLGISASNVKSHLTRLVGEGIVRREGAVRHAVYSLTDRRRTVVEGIAVRLEETAMPPWNSTWLSLAMRLPSLRSEREAVQAALWFDGFRPWGRETWLRPAWPMPWARDRAVVFVSTGGFCVEGAIVGTANLKAMRALFAIEALDRESHALAGKVLRGVRGMRSDAQAFALRHRLSGRIIDVIARDPRLPAELWHGSGLAELRRSYRHLLEATEAGARAFVERVTASSKV